MGNEVSKETQEKIMQLQNIQRQLQMIMQQRQQFEFAKMTAENAVKELENATGQVFKSIGPVLIETNAKDLQGELGTQVETLNERVDALKKQEERIVGKGKELEAEIGKEFEQK